MYIKWFESGLVFVAMLLLISKQGGFRLLQSIIRCIEASEIEKIITIDDRRDARSFCAEIINLAHSNGIPCVATSNRDEVDLALTACFSKTALVHGWYSIIDLKKFPNIEFFGFHYSKLPKYRGNAPVVWQLINGETHIGVSFFRFSTGVDDGLLISQTEIKVGSFDYISDILYKCDNAVSSMVDCYLSKLLKGEIDLYEQDRIDPTYYPKRSEADGLIDWTKSGLDIFNFIRAQSHPYPGAFTYLSDGSKMIIWRALAIFDEKHLDPGTFTNADDTRPEIHCADGKICVLDYSVVDTENN